MPITANTTHKPKPKIEASSKIHMDEEDEDVEDLGGTDPVVPGKGGYVLLVATTGGR